MPLLLSIVLFTLMSALATVVGMKLWARPRVAMERITGQAASAGTHLPLHPSLVFRGLIARIGSVVPQAGARSKLLQRRLIRAGYRHPHAVRTVYGVRLLLVIVLPVVAAMVVSGTGAAYDVKVMVIAGALLLGFAAPSFFVSWQGRRRQRRIRRGLPDALDLLVICVEAGLGLDQALMQTAKEMEIAHPDISQEFAMVNVELRTGKRRAEALRSMADRTNADELKKLVAVLIQADRFGTSVGQSLRTHADYLRVQSRQVAEEKAAKLGVKLVFPIFFCILPTLFVVTVGPMAVRIFREMLPMMNSM